MAMLTLSGLHRIGEAKKELCMRTELVLEGAGLQRWIEEHNLPGPVRMTKTLKDPESTKTLDWLWIDLGSLPTLETETYRSLITAAKTQGCKIVLRFRRSGATTTTIALRFRITGAVNKICDFGGPAQ